MSSPKDIELSSLSAISTSDLVRKVVESDLSVKYDEAVELVRRGEEAVPCLSKYLHEDEYWYADENGNFIADGYAPISALHLLGAIGSLKGLDDVLYTLYEHSDDLEDWLTEDMPSILASFRSQALSRLKECAVDKGLDLYGRDACVRAMAMIARREPSFRQEIVDFLRYLIQRDNESRELIAFIVWDLAELKDRSALVAIEEAFRRNKVEKRVVRFSDVLEIYNEEDEKDFQYHHDEKNPLNYFLESNLERLRETYSEWFAERQQVGEGELREHLGEDAQRAAALLRIFDKAGLVREIERVGRNDPCVCGSGLKYKRCCLPLQMERKMWDPLEDRLRALIQEFFDTKRFSEDLKDAVSLYGLEVEWSDLGERRLFHDWYVHDYVMPYEGRSIIEIFLRERGSALNDQEAKTVSSWANSTFRFLEILEVRSNVGFKVKDIFGSMNSQYFIFDALSSKDLEKGDILFARPYPVGSIVRLGGGGLVLPKESLKQIEEYVHSNLEAFRAELEKAKKESTSPPYADIGLDDYFRAESLSIIKYLNQLSILDGSSKMMN